jgi:hypothetical protein
MTDYFSIPSNIQLTKSNVNAGYVYGYDFVRDTKTDGTYNPDNIDRIDSEQNQVDCGREVKNAFPDINSMYYYNGYPTAGKPKGDPSVAMVVFNIEFTPEQQNILSTVITNHKNNVCINWCVKKSDGTFVVNPETEESQVFNSQETAQQVADALTDAIVIGVVVL